MWPSATVSVSLALLFARDASAFFRMPCAQPVVVDRADPIVNPNKVSGHLHTISGGNGFDFNMTFDTARQATCATCMAKQDLSNYWTPTLFFRNQQDGKFQRVKQVGGMTVYYLQRRSSDDEKLHAFPPNFRMLAGNPALRSYDENSVAQNAITHVCLGGPENGEWPWLPKANCPSGLRTQVFFPSCWNGKDVDSPDHKSHVAYPSSFNGGKCPETHPVRLVSIFYEVMWDVNAWADQWWNADGLGHPLVLSNGDPTGYGFHGDFLNGWDVDVLQRAIDTCNNNSGSMEDCGALELRTHDEMQDCELASRVPDTLNGWLDRLPGCNDISLGPENAKMQPPSACGASEVMLPKGRSPLTAVEGWTTVGCASEENGRALEKALNVDNLTPALCAAACSQAGYKFAGVEYGRECYCGNSIDSSKLGATRCNMQCAGDPNALCGGGRRLAVYQQGGDAPAPPPGEKPPVPEPTEAPAPVPTVAPEPADPPAPTETETAAPEPEPSSPAPAPEPTAEPSPAPAPEPTSEPSTAPAPPEPTTDGPEPTETPAPPTGPATPPGPARPPPEEPPVGGSTAFPSPDASWESLGCFVDPLRPRALRGSIMSEDVEMTPLVCVNHCAKLGFTYAGTEYGGECYCSNELSEGTVSAPDGECTKACEGDASAKCGGPARLNLYKFKSGGGTVILNPNPIPQQPPAAVLPVGSSSSSQSTTTATSSGPRKTHHHHHHHHHSRPKTQQSSANHTRRTSRMRFAAAGPHAS